MWFLNSLKYQESVILFSTYQYVLWQEFSVNDFTKFCAFPCLLRAHIMYREKLSFNNIKHCPWSLYLSYLNKSLIDATKQTTPIPSELEKTSIAHRDSEAVTNLRTICDYFFATLFFMSHLVLGILCPWGLVFAVKFRVMQLLIFANNFLILDTANIQLLGFLNKEILYQTHPLVGD